MKGELLIVLFRVFPTPVGVFLGLHGALLFSPGLPHARGGVSPRISSDDSYYWSSPRPWGCFCRYFYQLYNFIVFPTPVGVFLQGKIFISGRGGLPHARGGVSAKMRASPISFLSSPRPWGCFYHEM